MPFFKGIPRRADRLRLVLAVSIAATLFSPAWAQQPFNLEDYFPLAQNSMWHYLGSGALGSSPADNFSWTVLSSLQPVGLGEFATVIRTDTDQANNARNLDEDFWTYDSSHTLTYWGFHKGQADATLPVQDVVFSTPLHLGGRGLAIGQVLDDSGTCTVQITSPITTTTLATISSEVTYSEFVPAILTPVGIFTSVLHVTLEVNGTARYKRGAFTFLVGFPVRSMELYLAAGQGMIQIDELTGPNQQKVLALDQGQVAGQAIAGLPVSRAGNWTAYR